MTPLKARLVALYGLLVGANIAVGLSRPDIAPALRKILKGTET